jgi:2-haloacid dehalogenase
MIDRRTVLIRAAAASLAGMAMRRAGQAQGQARQKIQAIGFDGFTIFDPSSLNKAMEDRFPGRGAQLSTLWRTRQFEYCWLRTLNGKYADFWQVSDDSLEWAFKTAHVELTASVKSDLMNSLLELKPFPDSVAALQRMRSAGIRLAYVSNLTEKILEVISRSAGISELFEHSLSSDRVRAYKSDPRAYRMAEEAFRLPREAIVFAAFGGWDAAGAKSFGLDTFWVNRSNAVQENLGVEADGVGGKLADLADYVLAKA